MRANDLEGSAGLYRVRDELTKRVNLAVAPTRINACCSRKSSSIAMADQEDLAAEWGEALTEQGAKPKGAAAGNDDDMAAQWAAMIEDGGQFVRPATRAAPERILNQEEIDSLLGFNLADITLNENSGIRAIIDSAMVSYERLPMLEIVFDRLVRLMTTSLRNFTSDNVEVSLDRITSVRFGDYLNSIPLPAILTVFKAGGMGQFRPVHGRLEPHLLDHRRAARRAGAARPRSASRAGPTRRSRPALSNGWSRLFSRMPKSRSGRSRR
jgi:hypothetical protein